VNHIRLIKFRHRGLLHLYTEDNPKGVSASHLDKVEKLLLALETALILEQVGRFPGWKLHPLKGDMKGYRSLTVTGNWRIVFRYNETTNTASDIDLIDYH
jgi:proteic killer suppression protein